MRFACAGFVFGRGPFRLARFGPALIMRNLCFLFIRTPFRVKTEIGETKFHRIVVRCTQQQRQQTDDDMITSIHTLIYSDDAKATRAFLRDVLGWKYVAEDFDNDWLIFKSGPSEMGVHPTHSEWEGQTYDYPRHHSIALMCDDIDTTVEQLRAKGAQFRGPVEQLEYGRVIMMIVPGADDIQLYQPTHKLAYNL
jgi:predicted enzyme related to lactoylglutathione lyase